MTTNVEPMTEASLAESTAQAMRQLDAVRDAISVGRVFGDPVERDGVTVIPVAQVGGGGGGGGGSETAKGDGDGGGGFGSGFGLGGRPVGVVVIDRDGEVSWQPTVDVNQIVRRGQVFAGLLAVCATLILLRRR